MFYKNKSIYKEIIELINPTPASLNAVALIWCLWRTNYLRTDSAHIVHADTTFAMSVIVYL
jgi:hypothetical protein